jgi:PHP family Zn ribbon phosphoesterase
MEEKEESYVCAGCHFRFVVTHEDDEARFCNCCGNMFCTGCMSEILPEYCEVCEISTREPEDFDEA